MNTLKNAFAVFTRQKSAMPLIALVALVPLFSLGTAAFADERGMEIARAVDKLEARTSSKMRIEMTVRPEGGGEKRVFVIESSERENGDSLASFVEPKTIRGLRILSAGSDSWVFFPSTGRVRKIAGSSRSGSVQGVGGDFSYEDLGTGNWADDYAFDLAKEDDASWTITGKALKKDASYDAVELTVSKKNGRPLKAKFSSLKEGGFFKELSFAEYKDYGSQVIASNMEMRNLKTGSSTGVRVLEAAVGVTLDSRLFDPARFDK